MAATTKQKATERLIAHEAKVAEARLYEREIQESARHAQAEAARWREQMIALDSERPVGELAAAPGAELRKAQDEYGKWKARADGPWADRLAAAERRSRNREHDRDRFITDHLAELIAEATPEALAA